MYFYFYHALFNVLNTTFASGFYVMLEQNVTFDKEKYDYNGKIDEIEYVESESYDPIKG